MDKIKREDAIAVVDDLNTYLHENFEGSELHLLVFSTTDSNNFWIEFLDGIIWTSYEDERDFISEGEYESLKDFLKRECNNKIENLRLQKFNLINKKPRLL